MGTINMGTYEGSMAIACIIAFVVAMILLLIAMVVISKNGKVENRRNKKSKKIVNSGYIQSENVNDVKKNNKNSQQVKNPKKVVKAEPILEKTIIVPEKNSSSKDSLENYQGKFKGYYFDPMDGFYYKGSAPPPIKRKLDEIEKIDNRLSNMKPLFVELDTKKHTRKQPKAVNGFDDAEIYGKYVIESANGEFFYTLYSNKGESLYESENYASLEYCKMAVKRFKAHIKIGVFSIIKVGNDFAYRLKRRSAEYIGEVVQDDKTAQELAGKVKYYGNTDIIRVQ